MLLRFHIIITETELPSLNYWEWSAVINMLKDCRFVKENTLYFKLKAKDTAYEFVSDNDITAAHKILRASFETAKPVVIGLIVEKIRIIIKTIAL